MAAQNSEQSLSGQGEWQTLGAVSPVRLRDAGHYLRYALQWVERGARCCLESESAAGEEHATYVATYIATYLSWDGDLLGMFSPALGDGKRLGKRLGLRFSDGVPRLVFGESEKGAEDFVLDGHTDAEARQWVRECVESLSYSATSFNDPVLLPAHPLAEGARYKVAEHRESLAELSLWFGNAALLLERLQASGEAVCCSSAGFDLSLRHRRQGMGMPGLKMGKHGSGGSGIVGFCGGDLSYPQPYFYVVADPAWGSEPEWLGEGSRGVGVFHRQDFSGFVLLGEQVVQLAEQEGMVEMFLREAMEIPAG